MADALGAVLQHAEGLPHLVGGLIDAADGLPVVQAALIQPLDDLEHALHGFVQVDVLR